MSTNAVVGLGAGGAWARRLRAFGVAAGVAAAAVALGGCAGAVGVPRFNEMLSDRARNRAAFDFNCAPGSIRVVAIDARNFGAVGCGRRATYVAQPAICNPTNLTEEGVNLYCSVVMNSESNDGSADGSGAPVAPSVAANTSGCARLPWGPGEGVAEITVSTPLPAALPGPVLDGTYVLSGYEWHARGDHNSSRRVVMRIAGSTVEMGFAVGSAEPTTVRGTARFVADGTMSVEVECPRVGTLEFDRYAVTPTGITLISTAQNKNANFTRIITL